MISNQKKSSPEIAAIVPMRHNSERVRGKNYRPFAGKPLYHWIVTSLLNCDAISKTIIDTDSPDIRHEVRKHFPSIKLIDRPTHLCGGTVPMNEVLLYDVQHVQADFYLQTHSTNPLLQADTISRAIRLFLDAWPAYDSFFFPNVFIAFPNAYRIGFASLNLFTLYMSPLLTVL